MKKILSHHVFSMNFAAIFGLPAHANKPVDELVTLLTNRTTEVLGKLQFVSGDLALQDHYDIQVNATKPYVMGKLLHILNDWDSYLTDYLQTDFTFNLIYDTEVNSRLKCGLQTIQNKEALTELGAYLQTTLVLIRHQLSYVITILNQFNSLSVFITLSKKEQNQIILNTLKDFNKAIDSISFPDLTTENKMLDSFFKDLKSKHPEMKKILRNQLFALFKLKREQLNLALSIIISPAVSLTKSLTKDSSVIASVFLFLDKYEINNLMTDLKHTNFSDKKLEGLSRILNRFFKPALLLSDGHKRLTDSIQPGFTLFFESFLNLKSNYQDFIAQSETLFKFILDDLPDAKVDFDEKNAKVIAESLDTPKTSFITPTLIPLYPFSNDQIVELLQQKKAFIYCLRRVEYDGAFHWAIHKSVPLEFICSIIKEKTNASAVSIPEDLRVLFHDYLSQMPFFSLNITFYYLMNDSKEGDNRLCVLENKNSFESLIFLAQRNLINPNDVLTKMTGLSDYLFKFLPTNEQLKHFRTELKDAELDDFISTLAKDLLKELQYLKAIFEQCKLNQIKRSQIIVIKNELSAVRLHLLASKLVGASKESLKTLNDYKNIFNQILCDCLKLTDEYLIDEDLFYSNIQSTICSMWSGFYDFCYAEMDELGKTLAFKSKPEPQVAALQVFLFPKLDMLYVNIFNQLMWEVGEAVHSINLNSSIALGLTISFFQFFGFFKNVEYSTTFLLNITLPWFKKKKSELGLGELFFDSMLQEYKLAFSTLKSANTPSEVVLLRIIHECAAEYYESLVHLNGRQLPSIPNQFFELRSDFFGLNVFPEDHLNLGFKNAARFNFTDYQSPLQDEWFNVKSFESIINKNSSIFVGQLQNKQKLSMLATSFMSVIGTRLKLLLHSSQLDLEKEFVPNIRRNVKLTPLTRAELVDSYSKQIVFFVKSFIDSLNDVKDLNQLIFHFTPHSKRKSPQTKDFLDSILLLFLLPFKSAAAEKSQDVDQLIPIEIRLLLFPIIYEMFSKKHYRPTGLENLDSYKHVLVTNFFKPCFYQPFLPTITIPKKLKLIIQPVMVSAKQSSDWRLASDDVDAIIEEFFTQPKQSLEDFDQLFAEEALTEKKSKKKKKKLKNKCANGKPAVVLGTPLDTITEQSPNASVPNSAAHNLIAAQQPTSSYEQAMKNFEELFDFLQGDDFVSSTKKIKAHSATESVVLKWLENLPSDYQFEIPFNAFNQKSDLIEFLKQKQAAFSADHSMEYRNKTDVPAVLDDLIKAVEIRELQDMLSASNKSVADPLSKDDPAISEPVSSSIAEDLPNASVLDVISNECPPNAEADERPFDELEHDSKESGLLPSTSSSLVKPSTKVFKPSFFEIYGISELMIERQIDANKQSFEVLQQMVSGVRRDLYGTLEFSFLENCYLALLNDSLTLDIKNVYSQWLFGGINIINGNINHKLFDQSYNQNIRDFKRRYNKLKSAKSNLSPFLKEFNYLDKLLIDNPLPPTLNGYGLPPIHYMLNKAIYMLLNLQRQIELKIVVKSAAAI